MSCKSAAEKQREKEWKEVGDKVETKIMRKMKEWADDENTFAGDDDWDETCEKVEKKLKRKLREWAEKD
jgi:polyhydroxyalkanoate synthesis regulator phasin